MEMRKHFSFKPDLAILILNYIGQHEQNKQLNSLCMFRIKHY